LLNDGFNYEPLAFGRAIMTRPFETWKVLPHGKLTAVEDNLLTVVGDLHMPLGDFPRRMSVS
jgi:hypothetical protein